VLRTKWASNFPPLWAQRIVSFFESNSTSKNVTKSNIGSLVVYHDHDFDRVSGDN
jgi:hypothetical protein